MIDDGESRKKLVLTKLQAKNKAQHFCAYQERSQQEVRNKLYTWGLYSTEVEDVIADLITENFINEERFAFSYVSGKFNMKQWGKLKIAQGLKSKGVSPRLITEALNSIADDKYLAMLEKVLSKKQNQLNEKHPYKKKMKLIQYAAGKGFEKDLIFDVLSDNGLDE